MILDLLKQDGFDPRRVATTNGGEFASPCPACGGTDRFRSWVKQDRAWCRQCGWAGDLIQYLRDFRNLNFKDAATFVGKDLLNQQSPPPPTSKKASPAAPAPQWQNRADELVRWAHKQLISDPAKLEAVKHERGLTPETIAQYQLGWINKDIFDHRTGWGLKETLKDSGKPKKLLIPRGLVIPRTDSGKVTRIRIRRDKPGKYGRYHVLPGSSCTPLVIRTIKEVNPDPAIIVESELDAILLDQELKKSLTIVGLGSATIRPDEILARQLLSTPFILLVLDSDPAGAKQMVGYWKTTFRNSIGASIPIKYGKDPFEAFNNGLELNLWLAAAYNLANKKKYKPGHITGAQCTCGNTLYRQNAFRWNDTRGHSQPGFACCKCDTHYKFI